LVHDRDPYPSPVSLRGRCFRYPSDGLTSSSSTSKMRTALGGNSPGTRSHPARTCRTCRSCSETRLSSLCSFRTLYFTPESGPATEGFSCRGAVMNDEGNAARKIRKLRASRDLWKQRSAEKQQEIRQLRVTVRDLSSSRENWKTRVK